MDERVPAPQSKLPEYEVATNQLTWDLVHDSMAAQHPLLGQIRRVKVDHLPAEGAPHGVTVGFHAQPAELQYSFSIAKTDVRDLNTEAWASMIADAAENLVSQFMPAMFAALDESCRAAGTVVDAKGKPFSWDVYLDGIESIELDFDEAGEPKMPTLVVHPDMLKKIETLGPMTAEQESRKQAILQEKKRKFDARKRVRKLDR